MGGDSPTVFLVCSARRGRPPRFFGVSPFREALLTPPAKWGDSRCWKEPWPDELAELDDLGALGITYDDVVSVLEREGVEKFQASWEHLLETIRGELERIGAP